MFKHANTVSENQRVRLVGAGSVGAKTAGATGVVSEVDADMGIAIVRWTDGSLSHVAVEKLEADE